MNINNLLFFDKKGESYNLSWNSEGYWEGADYFLPISTQLYDNSNIFILEKFVEGGTTYHKFPRMEPGSKFEIIWKSAHAKNNLFLFTIAVNNEGPESYNYIEKQNSITVNYSDFGQTGGQNLNISYPFQINVAFTPTQEVAYSRVMQLYYTNSSGTNLVLEMTFYGEGEDEDERFRVWLENFGIRFNREDALLLKDYDLKESFSDWSKVNAARKQILVNHDQIYPYVGTYKGLLNLINLLGYRDILRVKEYWRDSDPNSNYYKKFAMVDVTDLMQVGDISRVNLLDDKGGLKSSNKFKKTEFLALAYQFTVATDTFDDDGLPEIEPTTEFTVDEIFFKLYGIAKKIEEEILPVNVIIRDIIGEFLYFSKFNLRNWLDEITVEGFQINDVYRVNLLEPNTKAIELKIRDIKTLYPKLNGTSAFPAVTYNSSPIAPYENDQKYDPAQMPTFIEGISDYYNALIDYEYWEGESNPADYGDDISTKIGCPIVLEASIPDFTLQDLDGVTFNDFITASPTTSTTSNSISTGTKTFSVVGVDALAINTRIKIYVANDPTQYMEGTITGVSGSSITVNITDANGTATNNTSWTIYTIDIHHTIGNIKYRNGYEIEWIITGPKEYYFTRRGKITDLAKIAHVLPYTGKYVILANVYDLQAGVSFDRIELTVDSEQPVIQVFTKIQDKSRYDFTSLRELTIADLGQSPLYDPFLNVINPNGVGQPITEVHSHYLNWFTYSNYWGVGTRLDEVSIFYEGEGFKSYAESTHPKKKYWGTGSIKNQPTLSDYSEVRISDLYYQDFSDMSYLGDSIAGFSIDIKSINSNTPSSYLHSLQFGGFAPLNLSVELPSATPQSLVNYLNSTTERGWSNYTYSLVGNSVKAAAKFQSKFNHSIITSLHKAVVYDQGYSISYPIDQTGVAISDTTISGTALYSFEEIYEAPTVKQTSGLEIGNKVRIENTVGGYVDGIITALEDDHFEVQAYYANEIGNFSQYTVYWLDTLYTFTRPITAFPDTTIESVQATLSQSNLTLDDDLLFTYSNFEDKLKNGNSNFAAPASRISYWINKGLVRYDLLPTSLYEGATQIDMGLLSANETVLKLTDDLNTWQHRSNSNSGWTPTADFYIKLDDSEISWENDKTVTLIFDSSIYLGNYSIRIVTDSLNAGNQGAYGKSIATLTKADFPLVDGISQKLALEITCNNASTFSFTVTKVKPEQIGYIPSYYDENSFTVSNIKSTYDTLTVPTNHPIFVVISNIASNVQTEWTLTDINDNPIINVMSPAYFVWRFDKPGSYKLRVVTTDVLSNEFRLDTSIAITSVMSPREYLRFIDSELAGRRLILADS